MKYAVKTTAGAMIYKLSFMTILSIIQKLIVGGGTHRHDEGDISLILFLSKSVVTAKSLHITKKLLSSLKLQ